MESKQLDRLWWERDDLRYENARLTIAGKDARSLADALGTPLFLYNSRRIRDNISRLKTALSEAGLSHRIWYAMKANRFHPILTWLKTSGLCGIDACSPEEVRRAIACGFTPEEISYTATSVSDKDLEFLVALPGLVINCDSLSMVRRLGERSPGREIGIRINPAMGVGYGSVDVLRYSGDKTTKFGIYQEQFDEALETAGRYSLTITRIHFHTGCGYLADQLPVWDDIIKESLRFADKLDTLTAVNVGGGLGVPHTIHDTSLDLSRWASVLSRHFKSRGVTVEVEPGDYIVKDSGLLLLDVNTVETKQTTHFIGVNGGFNLAVEPFFYSLPCESVPCVLKGDPAFVFKPENMKSYTIAGNINEALDVWMEDHQLPPVREGDTLAMINAGGYASSMSSDHCMRGGFSEVLLV